MSKPVFIPKDRQQQYLFAQEMNQELERITMSWDNDLREWHHIALDALKHASAISLNIPQTKYVDLFKEETHGVNMNIVAVLANNVESRTPAEMGYRPDIWADVLTLNSRVAKRWEELVAPVRERVAKRFQIMDNKPKMVIAEA